MRIDAIIQSTNYADMLELTLPQNLASFDTVTVYTKRGDEATKAVCAHHTTTCIETDRFTQNGSRFNRGAVYNEAFDRHIQHATRSGKPEQLGWFCLLDSDIVMPPGWRRAFEGLPPDQECFYGARRYNVETLEQYTDIQVRGDAALRELTLFRGIGHGYLQIFNVWSRTFLRLWRETRSNPYPEWSDGSTADWVFRNAFGEQPWDPPTQPPDHVLDHTVPEPCDPPTGLLRKLPFNVVHLGVTGVNSTGRHTPLWTVPSA